MLAGPLNGRINAALAAAGVGKAAWPVAGEAPASCDVMADARSPGSRAVTCCWIAAIVGWANDGVGIDAALEAVEKTPLQCCLRLIRLASGMGAEHPLFSFTLLNDQTAIIMT